MDFNLKYFFRILLYLVFISLFWSCQKDDDFNTDSDYKLELSSDSVLFDTVFTTLGSTTKVLMVYNNSDKPVKISSVKLEGGTNSFFRLNVDGVPGVDFKDVEIDANDSMFVFMTVRIDPANSNNPLVVDDKIQFITNGNIQEVMLVAWGQDAHYIVANKFVSGLPPYRIVAAENQNVVWKADKPYVVYGYAVVDSAGSLFIGPGVKIHFHKGSGLWVYQGGSIKVKGNFERPVIFCGDRLEASYQDVAGQWDRIWINEGSIDNEINYAIIENAFIGLQLETLEQSMGNQLKISNTIIRNMSGWGVFTRFYKVDASNLEITNCSLDAIYLSTGGNYSFTHCTIGNYWSGAARQTPSVLISNYYTDQSSQTMYAGNLSKAFFGNCIIYGNVEEELGFDRYSDLSVLYNYRFENCLIRTSKASDSIVNCIRNKDPLFSDISGKDFTLSGNSPCIGKGKYEIAQTVPLDFFGKPRLPLPDLGAYQYVP